MKRPTLALAALLLCATAARAQPAEPLARFRFMAGLWAETKDGVVTREAWMPPLGEAMAGATQTNRPGRPPAIEHAKITIEAAGVTYTAIVPGQTPTPFVLKPGGPNEAVFENLARDFPQRVIYRACGPDLCARIEGTMDGKLQSQEWRYRRAP